MKRHFLCSVMLVAIAGCVPVANLNDEWVISYTFSGQTVSDCVTITNNAVTSYRENCAAQMVISDATRVEFDGSDINFSVRLEDSATGTNVLYGYDGTHENEDRITGSVRVVGTYNNQPADATVAFTMTRS